MKKLTVTMIGLAIGFQAQAAKLETCVNKITETCGVISTLGVALDVEGDAFCKIIQGGRRDDGTKYSERVVVADANSVVSVETSGSNSCAKSVAQITGRVTDSVVIDGRMFFSHSSGAVIAIGRNNDIMEMLNSSGKSYSSAVGVEAAKDGGLIIHRENNQKTELDSEQLNERINKKSKVRCLTRGGC